MGELSGLPPGLRGRLEGPLDRQALLRLADDFASDVERGEHPAWHALAYRVSSPAACRGLLSLYRRARSELKLVRPEDLGARALGHFAPLRERFREPLWREVRGWLLGEAERA